MVDNDGGEAVELVADVTNSDDCRAMADACVEAWGP